MRLPLAFAALVLAPALAAAQSTGGVSAASPESVRDALVAWGHKARIDPGDDQGPWIAARTAEGINYVVYFYGCEAGANCLDLQFYASFTVDQPLDAQFMNDWNAEWVMGKGFLNPEGDPTVTFTVAGEPEMPAAYFQSVIEVWETSLDTFTTSIGW